MSQKRTCPCCGYRTLDTPDAGSYEICPVCFWEDDASQSADPDAWGGANDPSLREAQQNFAKFGACESSVLQHVRRPSADEPRDPGWQPVKKGSVRTQERPPIRELEAQEVASLGVMALRLGLIETADVVRWADSIIAAEDEPPYWAIELALAKPENVEELLNQVPGDRCEDLPRQALLALVERHWENGRLSIQDVHAIGRHLYFAGHSTASPDLMQWGIVLDCEFDEFDDGYRTEEDLRQSISKKLAHFARFASLLPAPMLPDISRDETKRAKVRLYRDAFTAAQDVLMREWDPIGVARVPMAQDEYDAYIPGALRMIADGKSDQEIADYLEGIETGAMGLSWAVGFRERNLRVAQWLRDAVQPFFTK